jgi:hypothetical protein
VLCRKVQYHLSRGRLSGIENGYYSATTEELAIIDTALDELIKAKAVLQQTAAALGCPSHAECT